MSLTEIFFVCLVVWLGLTANASRTLRVQVLLLVLGGTAALKAAGLGGATVTVPNLFLPFLWFRALAESRRLGQKPVVSTATFALGLAVLWGTVLAMLVPRLLAGTMEVMAISRDAGGAAAVRLVRLGPVSGNLTQTAYAVGHLLTFAAGRTLMRDPERREQFAHAIIALTLVNSAAGMLNVFEFYGGGFSLLDVVRTAYATTHQTFGSLPRIQGTFPETSAFSAFALALFAFTFQLWLDKIKPRSSGLAAGSSLVFLLFSTSGTAYAGLAIYFGFLTLSLFRRAASGRATPRFAWVLAAGPLLLSVLEVLAVAESPVVARLANFFDSALFQKMGSHSGKERGAWNAAAWKNFIDTYGLGLGFGSVRTSSFAITLLSNIGVIGTLFYALFLARIFFSGERHIAGNQEAAIRAAARHAVLASLVAACLSATVFDLGVGFYLFAAAASLPLAQRSPLPSVSAAVLGAPPQLGWHDAR